jgi:hypothetical protein
MKPAVVFSSYLLALIACRKKNADNIRFNPINGKIFIYIFSCTLLSLSCKKEKLPKATQEGKNTFGCKIDGKVFLPSKSSGLFGSPPVEVYNIPSNGFTLLAKYYGDGSDPFKKDMILYLEYLTSTGTYTLNAAPNQGTYELTGIAYYQTDAIHTGIVTITRCDLTSQIYSGTFSFTAIDKSTGKVVKVTDGRFDVQQ